MKTLAIMLLALLASTCLAQTAQSTGSAQTSATMGTASQQNQDQFELTNGTRIGAVLTKSIDAKKAKPGDEVEAKTLSDVSARGSVAIPKNSKLMGHVTEVKPYAKGEATSALKIQFDHAVLKNGTQVPVHAVIQAIAAPQNEAVAGAGGSDDVSAAGGTASGGYSGGGMAGRGAMGAPPAAAGARPESDAGSSGGLVRNTTGALTSATTGVIGLHGIDLDAQSSSAAQGSVLTSREKNVKLDSGTRLVLRVESQ